MRICAALDSVRSLLPQVLSVANLDNGLGARGASGVADRYFTPDSRRSRRISRLTPTYQARPLSRRVEREALVSRRATVTPSRARSARIEAPRSPALHRSSLDARGSDKRCQGPRRSLKRSSGARRLRSRMRASFACAATVTASRARSARIEAPRSPALHRSSLDARGSDKQCQGPRRSLKRSSGARRLRSRMRASFACAATVTPSRARSARIEAV